MMSELAKGKSAEDVRALFDNFHEAVTAKDPVAPEEIEKLDKLAALIGVREFPMRVKCATLPWHTMAAAIDESTQEVTTE
jgi:nitrogen fixation NifU-like protein